MIVLKSEPKPDNRREKRNNKKNNDDDEKYGSDTRRTTMYSNDNIAQRYIHKNTAQTSTVITNNGSKNSKCRPESDTQ